MIISNKCVPRIRFDWFRLCVRTRVVRALVLCVSAKIGCEWRVNNKQVPTLAHTRSHTHTRVDVFRQVAARRTQCARAVRRMSSSNNKTEYWRNNNLVFIHKFFFLSSLVFQFSFDNSRTYRKQLNTLNQTAVANRLCVPQCVVNSARAINIFIFCFCSFVKNEIQRGIK